MRISPTSTGLQLRMNVRLTNCIQKLVALIENKVLDMASVEALVSNEGVQSTRCSNDDMRASILVLENFNILGLAGTAVEDRSTDIRHVLAESGVLVLDLVSELASVAQHNDTDLTGNWLDLLKCSNDEDSSFTC